jgi:flavodoxin
VKALAVYESMWGNTEQVARAVAAGVGESYQVEVFEVSDAPKDPGPEVSLIVAGGPTHAFSMSRPNSRTDAHSHGADHGTEGFGLREWLEQLPAGEHPQVIATFDTKVKKAKFMPGAARSAAKVAEQHGYHRAAHAESFYVQHSEGPLVDGEIERATQWGRQIAEAATRSPSGA